MSEQLPGMPPLPPPQPPHKERDCDRHRRLTIRKMHERFGRKEPRAYCRTCAHLVVHWERRRYYKCERYRISYNASSDWRLSYVACGLHKERTDDTNARSATP